MTIEDLLDACSGKCLALTTKIELESVGGGKIMPPVYLARPNSKDRSHWTETRVVDGKHLKCAVLDSIQSQANRLEEALQQAVENREISLPVIRVSFDGHDPITSLSAPHRVYDAWLRHANLDGVPFRETKVGREISEAQPLTATALLRYAPTVLLFGGWDSQVNAKTRFARAIASEVVAIGIEEGQRAASRIDPINLRVSLERNERGAYSPASGKNALRASEVGLASVAPHLDEAAGGVSAERLEQTVAVSFAQLRRLRFPVEGSYSKDRDVAGRAVIAALGILAVQRSLAAGHALRSGCWLRPKGPVEWRLLGATPDLDSAASVDNAISLYSDVVGNARKVGLEVDGGVYDLEPDPGLVEAVKANPTDEKGPE